MCGEKEGETRSLVHHSIKYDGLYACIHHIIYRTYCALHRRHTRTNISSSSVITIIYKNVPYKSVIQPDNTFWKSRFPTHISGRFTESIIPLDNTLTKICNVRDNTFRQFIEWRKVLSGWITLFSVHHPLTVSPHFRCKVVRLH